MFFVSFPPRDNPFQGHMSSPRRTLVPLTSVPVLGNTCLNLGTCSGRLSRTCAQPTVDMRWHLRLWRKKVRGGPGQGRRCACPQPPFQAGRPREWGRSRRRGATACGGQPPCLLFRTRRQNLHHRYLPRVGQWGRGFTCVLPFTLHSSPRGCHQHCHQSTDRGQ